MVRLLIGRRKSTEYKNVFVRYLVQTTAFKTDPVCVLFYSQIKSFPVLSSPDVVFLDQVGPLSSVKASNDI